MKDLKKLNGAKELSKMEQKTITGGGHVFPDLCIDDEDCGPNQECVDYDSGNGTGVCAWILDPVQP